MAAAEVSDEDIARANLEIVRLGFELVQLEQSDSAHVRLMIAMLMAMGQQMTQLSLRVMNSGN